MAAYRTTFAVHAPPEGLWAILTDFGRWAEQVVHPDPAGCPAAGPRGT